MSTTSIAVKKKKALDSSTGKLKIATQLAEKFHEWLVVEMCLFPQDQIPTVEDLIQIFNDRRCKEVDVWHWIVDHVKSLNTMCHYSATFVLSSVLSGMKENYEEANIPSMIYIGDFQQNEVYQQKLAEIEQLKSRRIQQHSILVECRKQLNDKRCEMMKAEDCIRMQENTRKQVAEEIFLLKLCEKKLSDTGNIDNSGSGLVEGFQKMMKERSDFTLVPGNADKLYEALITASSPLQEDDNTMRTANRFLQDEEGMESLSYLSLFGDSQFCNATEKHDATVSLPVVNNVEATSDQHFLKLVTNLVHLDIANVQSKINDIEAAGNRQNIEKQVMPELDLDIHLLKENNKKLKLFTDSLEDMHDVAESLKEKLKHQSAFIAALDAKCKKQNMDIRNAESECRALELQITGTLVPQVENWQKEIDSLSLLFKSKVENKFHKMAQSLQEGSSDRVETVTDGNMFNDPVLEYVHQRKFGNTLSQITGQINGLQKRSQDLTLQIQSKLDKLKKSKIPERLDRQQAKREQRVQVVSDNMKMLREFSEKCMSNVNYTKKCKDVLLL